MDLASAVIWFLVLFFLGGEERRREEKRGEERGEGIVVVVVEIWQFVVHEFRFGVMTFVLSRGRCSVMG